MLTAKKFREEVYSCEHFRQFTFTSDDNGFYEYLEFLYKQEKKPIRKIVANTQLFVLSVGLFAFGRLDVAEDILDNIPSRTCPASHLASILNRLLPLPHKLSCYKTPNEFREWLRTKSIYLTWSEIEERYILENFKVLPEIFDNSNLKAFCDSNNSFDDRGLIIEIFKEDGTSWKGQFQAGNSGISGVYQHPNRDDLIVVSDGKGYVINPENQDLLETFGREIIEVIELFDSHIILFRDSLGFISYDKTGFLWHDRELSWNALRKLQVERNVLIGECKRFKDRDWESFWLNAKTGEINFQKYDPVNDIVEKLGIKNRPWWKKIW